MMSRMRSRLHALCAADAARNRRDCALPTAYQYQLLHIQHAGQGVVGCLELRNKHVRLLQQPLQCGALGMALRCNWKG